MTTNASDKHALKLELHADDLGATSSVNKGILTAWREGGVDGVSALANGDALQEAATDVNAEPDRPLRMVAHLNLSEGKPSAPSAEIPLLVNSNGQLNRGFVGLWLFWLRSNRVTKQAFLEQITTEWRAQIDKIQRTFAPRTIVALDGHIHVHMLPFTFPIAVSLANEFGIKQIRISSEVRHFSLNDSLRLGFLVNIIKHQLLRILAVSARRRAQDSGLRSPDAVAGLLYSGRMSASAIEAAAAAARRNDHDWLEVICHPGRATPGEELRWKGQSGLAGFYMSADRDFEYRALLRMSKARSS
jgi:predicted glycoside hydrolase/deacetylase ChbG (UPF0249 family)